MHRGVGGCGDELAQEIQEAPVLGDQLRAGVPIRVALPFHPQTGVRGRVDVEREVGHRTGGQQVQGPGRIAQIDAGPEVHDVDGRAESARVRASTRDPRHFFAAETLMAQRPAQLAARGGEQLGDRYRGPGAQPQRNDIVHHAAGAAQHRGGASGHRQAERHLGRSRHPGEVTGQRGHQHSGGAGRARCLLQRRVQSRLERTTHHDGLSRGRPWPRRERHRFGQTVHLLGPVAAIGVVPGRPQVGDIGVDQVGGQVLGPGGRLLTAHHRRVQLGVTLLQPHGAVAVEGDVMGAAVDEVAVGADVQDRRLHGRIVAEVERGALVRAHPGVRGGFRVGFAA